MLAGPPRSRNPRAFALGCCRQTLLIQRVRLINRQPSTTMLSVPCRMKPNPEP